MMSEAIAKAFHEAYERLAPFFGYTTRRESAVPWEEVPEQNRRLMIAVTDEVIGEGVSEIRQTIQSQNWKLLVVNDFVTAEGVDYVTFETPDGWGGGCRLHNLTVMLNPCKSETSKTTTEWLENFIPMMLKRYDFS